MAALISAQSQGTHNFAFDRCLRCFVFSATVLFLTAVADRANAGTSASSQNAGARHMLDLGINYDYWARRSVTAPPLSAQQIAEIASAGFRHIRLPLNPRAIGFDFTASPTEACAEKRSILPSFLRTTVPALKREELGLVLVIDGTEDTDALAKVADDSSGNLLASILDCVIRQVLIEVPHFAERNVIIGNFNEPKIQPEVWRDLQERGLEQIAKRYPSLFFLATPAFPTHLDGLINLRPIDAPNIGYEFHFYEPYPFTHQGISSAPAWLRDKISVQLRQAPAHVNAAKNRCDALQIKPGAGSECVICTSVSEDEFCQDYARTHANDFGLDYVRRRFRMVAEWAQGRYIYLGEFGVNKGRTEGSGADPESRLYWLRTVSQTARAFGFGRSLFEIGCGMGLSRSTMCSPSEFERTKKLEFDLDTVKAIR